MSKKDCWHKVSYKTFKKSLPCGTTNIDQIIILCDNLIQNGFRIKISYNISESHYKPLLKIFITGKKDVVAYGRIYSTVGIFFTKARTPAGGYRYSNSETISSIDNSTSNKVLNLINRTKPQTIFEMPTASRFDDTPVCIVYQQSDNTVQAQINHYPNKIHFTKLVTILKTGKLDEPNGGDNIAFLFEVYIKNALHKVLVSKDCNAYWEIDTNGYISESRLYLNFRIQRLMSEMIKLYSNKLMDNNSESHTYIYV